MMNKKNKPLTIRAVFKYFYYRWAAHDMAKNHPDYIKVALELANFEAKYGRWDVKW